MTGSFFQLLESIHVWERGVSVRGRWQRIRREHVWERDENSWLKDMRSRNSKLLIRLRWAQSSWNMLTRLATLFITSPPLIQSIQINILILVCDDGLKCSARNNVSPNIPFKSRNSQESGQVWNTIRATVGSGQAVLLTSHSMAEVNTMRSSSCSCSFPCSCPCRWTPCATGWQF